MLKRAIAVSPDFAAAYAYNAFMRSNESIIGKDEAAEQSLQTSLQPATRAVAIAVAGTCTGRSAGLMPFKDALDVSGRAVFTLVHG